MRTRRIGPFEITAIGLGCMSLSHAYGVPPPHEHGVTLLRRALDLGYTFFDTAALYGLGANETLVGEALADRRSEFTLASKCGLGPNAEGRREIDGRPEVIKRTCEDSLRRLRTDVIDLYYLHRWDKRVPIEDSVGALGELVAEGKVRTIGLSEVSAMTLRRAHAVHPITAVQSEYSLWTRNPEVAVLEACREIGATFVAFGSLGRGFLADGVKDPADLVKGDIRAAMPRFIGDDFRRNRALLPGLFNVARHLECTPAQLALAWVLARGDHVVTIPGTARLDHMEENLAGGEVLIDTASLRRLDELINPVTVSGHRYPTSSLAEIDTEEMPA